MSNTASSRAVGVGRVLIAVYAILALAATARSAYQIATKFDVAPVAYLLSALAGVVYIVATIALIGRGSTWYRVAWVTLVFELAGVLAVGTLSLVDGVLFPADTVWSFFGRGYLFIPLVLPILGMLWLYRRRPSAVG
ncbi:membrane protein [soil metagenome]